MYLPILSIVPYGFFPQGNFRQNLQLRPYREPVTKRPQKGMENASPPEKSSQFSARRTKPWQQPQQPSLKAGGCSDVCIRWSFPARAPTRVSYLRPFAQPSPLTLVIGARAKTNPKLLNFTTFLPFSSVLDGFDVHFVRAIPHLPGIRMNDRE